MDELNVHHMWGISPFLNLCAAVQAAGQPGRTAAVETDQVETCLLQVCPYDCRHTLATINSHAAHVLAAAAGQQQPCQQLDLFVYESDPENLARHMLLLAVLVDASFTARERAEMFLELHGNILLRQRTADWVCNASRQLEAAVAEGPNSPGHFQQQHQQAAVQDPVQAVVCLFDLSMLRYKERDLLLETFQQYRSKAAFGMADAWDGRCRKWYGDRFDCRQNLIDWDYHMRLIQRGTPFLDPAAGSIIHFYHFRHWRLTGVAYELRESSYTATNTSMLATAYGRTREYKDRSLRDIGRSIAAYGYWGDIINPPYHALGTVADDPALFKQVNKQFSHTSVDVAEHNILGFIKALCSTGRAAVGAVDAAGVSKASIGASSSSSAGAHRARAARGPTSLEQLTDGQHSKAQHGQQTQQQQGVQLEQGEDQQQEEVQQLSGQAQQGAQELENSARSSCDNSTAAQASAACNVGKGEATRPARPDAAAAADQAAGALASVSLLQQQEGVDGEQGTSAAAPAAQAAAEAAQVAAAVQNLSGSVKIHLLTGDLQQAVTGKAAFAQRFAAATVGHRHVHLLGPAGTLSAVLRPGAPLLVETAANMVQLSKEQVAAFDNKLLELAGAAGFQTHPSFCSTQQQPGHQGQDQQSTAGNAGGVTSWRLPPGYVALCATG